MPTDWPVAAEYNEGQDADTDAATSLANSILTLRSALIGDRIKLLPQDFTLPGNVTLLPRLSNDTTPANGVAALGSRVWATVNIPAGYKATAFRLYGSNTADVCAIYECDISGAAATSKGTGTLAAEVAMTSVSATSTNFLLIKWDGGYATLLYGGYVLIEET